MEDGVQKTDEYLYRGFMKPSYVPTTIISVLGVNGNELYDVEWKFENGEFDVNADKIRVVYLNRR